MKKVCLIGAGGRGNLSYGPYILDNGDVIEYCAIVDINPKTLKNCGKKYNISDENLFLNEDDFYSKGKICDAVLIANQDKDHYYSLIKSMELGYDILVEKPVTPSEEELDEIYALAKKYDVSVMVCHELRYTTFFSTIKDLLDEGEIGKIIGIDHTEYIGNYHMAHSYVRGHWAKSAESSPIVLSKTCHDMDILTWYVGSKVESVYSTGKLNYFKKENAPKGYTKSCFDCPHINTCRYSAKTFYLENPKGWMSGRIFANTTNKSEMEEVLRNSNYGKCVYDLDNDVCDHQVAIFKFENGVDVTFTMTAFTQNFYRATKIFGTDGIIEANTKDFEIKITKFGSFAYDEEQSHVIKPVLGGGEHMGGDYLLMEDFAKMIGNKEHKTRTSLDQSIQSHKMSYSAEKSRLSGKVEKIIL